MERTEVMVTSNWRPALIAALFAGFLCGAPNIGRLGLSFEPGLRNSEFVAHSGGLSVVLTATGAAIGDGRMRLLGSQESAAATLEGLLPGYTNYLLDKNPRKWRTHVPNYRRVRYHNVYPGIDVVYYGNPHELEFDFIVAPGADPHRIQLALSRPDLQIRLPRIYQDNQAVEGRAVRRGNRVSFELTNYDHSRPLVIDPVLSYAVIFGGGSFDEGRAITVDSTGATYVVGNAFDGNFPLVNGKPGRFSFLAKLNAAGDALVYSTYLPLDGGGPGTYAVDATGSAYLTRDGRPGTPIIGPLGNCSSPPDVYVAKLSSDGASLVYSGCIGGSNPDYPSAIAVDAAGNAYVTGFTQSPDFPLLKPVQSTHPDGPVIFEGFVFKLSPTGRLLYSTFLGGGHGDFPRAIAVDLAGNAYIAGQTNSLDFPLKYPIQGRPKSSNFASGFVVKINADGSDLVYSTYLGGSSNDFGSVIAADAFGNAYVAGSTTSADFPTTPNALQGRFNGIFAFKTTDGAASWIQSDSGLPGAVYVLRVDPNSTSTVYALSSGRLFKSSDRGATWRAIGTGSIYQLWINPVNSTLYVTSDKGELLRSRDAGASFSTLNTGLTGSPNQMVFDTKNASVIYGRWGGRGAGDGVYKSIDGGDTWKPTGLVGSSTGSGGLAVDPAVPSRLYVSTNRGGLFRSDDGGENFTSINKDLVSSVLLVDSSSTLYAVAGGAIWVSSGDTFVKKTPPAYVGTLVIDPAKPSTWYAITYGPTGNNIYKSIDNGDTFQPVNKGLPSSRLVQSLAMDPGSPGTLYLGMGVNPDGFFAKLNSNGSWLQYSTFLGGSGADQVGAIAVDLVGNAYVAGTTDSTDFPFQAAFRSTGTGFVAKFDAKNTLAWSSSLGAATPSAMTLGPAGELYLTGSTSSAAFPTPGPLHEFISGNFFRTSDGGTSWAGSTLTPSSTSGFPFAPVVVADPKMPSRVFALADYLYVSNDSGQTWTQLGRPGVGPNPGPIFPFSVLALVLDPVNPATMYAAGICAVVNGVFSGCGVSKSTDGGLTWALSPIIAAGPGQQPAFVAGLAIDPRTPSILYAAVNNGGIYKTTDAGATWNASGSLKNAAAVAVDPLNPAIVYASVGSNGPASISGPFTGSLDRSTDSGTTWTAINNGLPSGWWASILVVDPAVPGRVYAVGSFQTSGLYRTDDGGNNWIAIGSGLPDSPVYGLAIDPTNSSVVYAAPSAGGLYRSTDAGASWTLMTGLKVPIVHSVAIDAFNPSLIYAGTELNPQDVFVMKILP
jgi:photosystem II stability/assembly factor-like uncharacterized protein